MSKEKVAAYQKAYQKANKEKLRTYNRAYNKVHKKEKAVYNKAYQLQKKYGITLEEKRTIYRQQNGRCAICNKELIDGKDCHADHCHKTNKVRGLLCAKCNQGLGLFNDNPNTMTSAIKYLRKYNG